MDSEDRKREIAERKERLDFNRRKFEQERYLHDAEYYDLEEDEE